MDIAASRWQIASLMTDSEQPPYWPPPPGWKPGAGRDETAPTKESVAAETTPETFSPETAASTPAKFCPDCGTPTEGAKFCPNCGRATGAQAAPAADQSRPAGISVDEDEREVWRGAPDPVLSPLAAKTTSYVLTTDRLKVSSGVVGRRADQMELFRVKDVRVKKNLRNRTRSRGDVIVISVDNSSPLLKLESIENPESVAEMIRNLVRDSRRRHGVVSRELM